MQLGRSALDAKDPRNAADEHGTLEAKGYEVLRRRLVDDLGGFGLDKNELRRRHEKDPGFHFGVLQILAVNTL